MNKKGFSPIELLISLIVIGVVIIVTIPIICTIQEKTKQKTFKTAASSIASWIDGQYQIYKMNLEDTAITPLDTVFSSLCIKKTNEKENIGCDEEVHLITYNLIIAAGIKMSNIITKYQTSTDTLEDIIIDKENYANYTNTKYRISRIYINPLTSRSCITLISQNEGEYPSNKVVCGGVCQSEDITKKDYCKEGLIE